MGSGSGVCAGVVGDGDGVVVHPVRMREGELAGVVEGLHELREERVRGCKLVFLMLGVVRKYVVGIPIVTRGLVYVT